MKSIIALFMVVLAACGGDGIGDSTAESIPAPMQKGTYFGTSSSDIWAYGGAAAAFSLSHWDGSAWTEVGSKTGLPRATSACAIEAGKVWIAGDIALGTLDLNGTYTDLSAMAPVAPPSAFRNVACGNGEVLLNTGNQTGTGDISQLFRWDGTRFVSMPQPSELRRLGAVTVFAEDDIYASAADPVVMQTLARDTGGPDFHFDGTAWTRGTANSTTVAVTGVVGVAGVSTAFPPDDIWLSCGANAMHFDGSILRPLAAPRPAANECRFSYVDGHPIMLFNGVGGSPETAPTAYQCDQGNCELLDVQGEGKREYRRVEWDGKAWVNEQRVATVKACVGAACGYNGGGASSNVAGVLDDGTLLLQAVATDGSATIYLVQ